MLVRGEKPAAFPANKAITKRDWKHSLLAYDEDKIKKFDEMRKVLASGEYSQIPLDF